MALFFDAEWFDARLKACGATRDDVANLLALKPAEIAELWKDQRELRVQDVLKLARFLNVPAAEIANKAGVSTPIPKETQDPAVLASRIDDLTARVATLERALAELKAERGKS